MYAKYAKFVDTGASSRSLSKRYIPKQYHHIKIDKEFKQDCAIWLKFITEQDIELAVNRPMIDLSYEVTAHQIRFYSDASAAERLGFGCIYNKRWIFGQWEPGFIRNNKPSIEYLELYALVAGLLTWQDQDNLNNTRVVIFCDNQAVMHMVNNITSSCPNCMHLIRIMVLNGMIHNRRVFVKFVPTKKNGLADALSHLDLDRFRRLDSNMNLYPDKICSSLWPVSKIWQGLSK